MTFIMGIYRNKDTGEFTYRTVSMPKEVNFNFDGYLRNLNSTAEFKLEDPAATVTDLIEIQDILHNAAEQANKTGELDVESLDAKIKPLLMGGN